MRILILLAICLLAGCQAVSPGQQPAALQAVATTDSTEVHPDNVFDVNLSLVNLTGETQTIKIPDCGWDAIWRSSNGHVTWDFWDCDYNDDVSIEIAPHDTYVFPKPLKMYVESADRPTVKFSMGFKDRAINKTLWSSPISLDVTP
jgi:hypothetical protein